MLQDACGEAAMNVGLDEDTSTENNLMPEEPNADAQKFYRLLKEYQQPLTVEDSKPKEFQKSIIKQKMYSHFGNLSFVEVEDILTKENDGVKPTADVIWLVQHTHTNKEDKLEWADGTRSKIIHEKLKNIVATVGDSMTQEERLIQVLQPGLGMFVEKGLHYAVILKENNNWNKEDLLSNNNGKYKNKNEG